eukprot:1372820-Rhodomonas_salina.2
MAQFGRLNASSWMLVAVIFIISCHLSAADSSPARKNALQGINAQQLAGESMRDTCVFTLLPRPLARLLACSLSFFMRD